MEDGYTRTWIITKPTRINEYVYALPVEECACFSARITQQIRITSGFLLKHPPIRIGEGGVWGGCVANRLENNFMINYLYGRRVVRIGF